MASQYNPLQDAMGILQMLGQRRAQQQQFQLGQGHLDNETQRVSLDQQRMAQQGDQFDRGLGMEQQNFEQRGRHFDRNQALAEHVQKMTEGRNQMMDPAQLAHTKAQTAGINLNNQMAPQQAALAQQKLAMEQQQLEALKQHYGVSDAISAMAQGPQTMDPSTGMFGPQPDLVRQVMNMLKIPQAPPQPPVNLAPFNPQIR